MRSRRQHRKPQLAHASRVSAVVALIMAVLYIALAVPIDAWYSGHVVGQVDARVSDRLDDIVGGGGLHLAADGLLAPDKDIDDAPVVVWRATANRDAVALTDGAPALAAHAWRSSGRPITSALQGQEFRLQAVRFGDGWLVAGESLAVAYHLEAVVEAGEVVAGPLFVGAMFLGSLAIGLMTSRPVEQARRRQLDFTADASHELRTPLTVIEAEVGLSLSTQRQASSYRGTLERIGTEGERLRHIVEDLLFLARFDSAPPVPHDEPVDMATLAETCVQRFSAVAQARGTNISLHLEGDNAALVKAPPSWADRVCGVLVDNACRFAGERGYVLVRVCSLGNLVSLAVDDSGPGIAPVERPYLFDRFHRSTGDGQGAGLGLAIADAVVRSTGGKWRVGSSPLGGARMEVVWHRHQTRHANRWGFARARHD